MVGVQGTTTGFRCEGVIVDDAQKDAGSEATRQSDLEWFRAVVQTRLEPGGWIVVIATRWHDNDLPGALLDSDDGESWTRINLPAFAEEDDPLSRPVGEALWPEKWPAELLEQKRTALGAQLFSTLYMGSPVPAGGAVFKVDWLQNRWLRRLDRYSAAFTVMVIDGAWSAKSSADPSALALWATDERSYFLNESLAKRAEFPDLLRLVSMCYREWKPHAVVVEQAASGIPLLQELHRSTGIPLIGVVPKGDKVARASSIAPLFECGRVFLPQSAPWLPSWIEEHLRFPAGRHDDQVECTSLALTYLHERNIEAQYSRRFATSFSTAR